MTRFIDEDDENYILKDGESRSCRLMMKDSITPRDAVIFDAASHRPGHRYPATNDAAKRNEMYADADRELSDAWKTKTPPPSGAYPEGTSHAGGACTVNGSPGTLQRIDGHDG